MKAVLKRMVLATLFLFSTSVTQAAVAASSSSTEQVWQHHIEAWQSRDLDGIVSDYTESSVLILNGRLFQGTQQIRSAFAQLFQIFDGGENRIDPVIFEGRIVYITWHFTPAHESEQFGTDTFVIEQGKIQVQTIASQLYDHFPVK